MLYHNQNLEIIMSLPFFRGWYILVFEPLDSVLFQFTLSSTLHFNINKHLALDSIPADCQHGFRSQGSCETQLVQFVHDIISKLDRAVNREQKQTDLIIMDFA